jgi:hypothetical protein
VCRFFAKRQVGSRLMGLDFRRSNLVVGLSRLQELGDVVLRRLAEGATEPTHKSLRTELGMTHPRTSAISSSAPSGVPS